MVEDREGTARAQSEIGDRLAVRVHRLVPSATSERLAAVVLLVLLLGLGIAATTFDRARWPTLVGDEATYLMAAQSLAWDGDLRYTLGDLERFRRLVGRAPDGLILQSSDGGSTLYYAKPITFPLYLAPFVRLFPQRGPAVANWLALGVAALASTATLRRVAGAAAPLWMAAFVFGSVTFAHVFWVHADLFLLSLVALALSLLLAAPRSPGRTGGLALPVAAALLAGVALTRPVYALVLLPGAVAAWRRRKLAVFALAVGVVVALGVASSLLVRGSWTSYGAERQGYYEYTGFPGAGAAAWREGVAERGANSWVDDALLSGIDLRLQGWNAIYTAVGRHVGLLPYFLPLVLGLATLRRSSFGWSAVLAFVLAAAVFSWLRPFNFWGGGGALANRYLLPMTPLLWTVGVRVAARGKGDEQRLPPVLAWSLPVVVVLLAAPFMAPTWQAPGAYVRDADGGYHHVSRAAFLLLPHETSQKHLKPAGREDFHVRAGGPQLWVKPLAPGVEPFREVRGVADGIAVAGSGELASVLLGNDEPLDSLQVLDATGRPLASVAGRRLRPRAVHSMWWTGRPFYLYELNLGTLLERAGHGERPAIVHFEAEPRRTRERSGPGGQRGD